MDGINSRRYLMYSRKMWPTTGWVNISTATIQVTGPVFQVNNDTTQI